MISALMSCIMHDWLVLVDATIWTWLPTGRSFSPGGVVLRPLASLRAWFKFTAAGLWLCAGLYLPLGLPAGRMPGISHIGHRGRLLCFSCSTCTYSCASGATGALWLMSGTPYISPSMALCSLASRDIPPYPIGMCGLRRLWLG